MDSEAEKWNKGVDHPLQSWEWGEFRKLRQPVDRIDGMLVVWTPIKFTPWVFGYIPMGKVPSDEEIERLRDLGKKRNAIGIRMEPNQVLGSRLQVLERLPKGRPVFKKKTYLLDLTKSEEELLESMHPKGRYNIKIAQKHGVTVEENSLSLSNYLDLMFKGTARRQGIYMHSRKYHEQLWATLKNGIAHLFVAKYRENILAADMIFGFKDKIYYAYGASALEHREVMAPTLLLWEIVCWGKRQGYKSLDLWGAEEGRGFSRFKEQFGGELTEMAGTYDLPIKKQLYPLFRLVEEARWKILRILK